MHGAGNILEHPWVVCLRLAKLFHTFLKLSAAEVCALEVLFV